MGQGSPKSPGRRARGSVTSASAKKVSFNGMHLTELSPEHLSKLHPKLQEVTMMNNAIEELPDGFFDGMPILEYFDAGYNALSKIPSSIGNAIKLKQVQFNQNTITSLPEEIGELAELTALDLCANQLKSFSSQLGNLENLERIDLSSNFLEEIPDDIATLTSLQALRVRGNQLKKITSQLSALPVLEILDLRHNFLTSLPSKLLLTSLERLLLSHNQLTSLPSSLEQSTAVSEMDLSNNQLTGLIELGDFAYLKRIDAEFNQIRALPASIGQLEAQLTDLNLNDNLLESLPAEIGNLQSLVSLSLRNNKLKQVPPELGRLNRLENLDLALNLLTELPKELGGLVGLDRLNLDENYLTALPKTFSSLWKLKTFGIGLNTGVGDSGIRKGVLAGMTSLVELRFFGNAFTEIPEDVCTLTQLERIFMGSNQISSIPADFTKLTRLQHLYLSDNKFESFPKELFQLTNLRGIWLNGNQLSRISEDVSQLIDLNVLDVSNNQMKKLPTSIGKLKQLHELNVSRNDIKLLPATIGECEEIVALDASFNPIERIPTELAKPIGLMHAKFAYCRIQDIVDPSEGEFNALRWLCLEGNPCKRVPLRLQGLTDARDETFLKEKSKQEVDDDIPITIKGLPSRDCELFDMDIAEMQGIRPTMEDSILIKDVSPLVVGKHTFKLICVFDGHADSRAAEYCAVNYHQFLEDELKRTLTRRMRLMRENKKAAKAQAGSPASRQRSESDRPAAVAEKPAGQDTPSKKRAQSVLATKTSSSPDSTPAKSPSKKSKKTKKDKGDGSSSSASTPKMEDTASKPDESSSSTPSTDAATSAADSKPAEVTLDLDSVMPQALEMSLDRIRSSVFDKEIKSGCTAAFVLLFGNKMWFVSVGDARAIMCVNKQAKRGTRDHKALDSDERIRVQQLGGFLAENGRLLGKIAVSRAIGDQEFYPYVNSEPYVHLEEISDSHEFVIVACDGVWDALSDEKAVELVRGHYKKTKSYVGSANLIRDLAYQLGSGDNISVIVAGLKCSAPASSESTTNE